MPAANVHQQRLMCQALGIKKGSIKAADLNPKYKDTIVKAANSMTEDQLNEYCKVVKS